MSILLLWIQFFVTYLPFIFIILAAVIETRCAVATKLDPGCRKDHDCKLQRICEESRCIWPPAPRVEKASNEAMPIAALPPSRPSLRRMYRGGPGAPSPLKHNGPTTKPSLKWKVDLGAVVFATPAIQNHELDREVAWVGTHAGRFVGVVISGDEAGNLVFDRDFQAPIWSSAAIASDQRVYVGTSGDKLHAIDSRNGAELWALKLGDCSSSLAPGPEGARCDVDGGPTIGPDGDIYVGADGIYRISPDGKVRWHWPQKKKSKHVFSSPLITQDGKLYVGTQDASIVSLDLSGQLRWSYRVESDVDGSPVIDEDGGVFVGADDGRIYALRSDGSLRWSFLAQRDIRSSLAIAADGTVYSTSFDGSLYAIRSSGQVEWVLRAAGVNHGSPVIDREGRIYFASQDDHLYSVAPNGELLWSVDLGVDSDSSVAISKEGILIIGCDDGTLRAYQ